MPQLYACARCGRVHARGECPVPPVRYERRPKEKTDIARFRSTQAWRRMSKQIRERDGVCRLCLSRGLLSSHGLEVHHIVPVAVNDKLKLDPRNLITLCKRCHELVEGDPVYMVRLKTLAAQPPRATSPRGSSGSEPPIAATTALDFSSQNIRFTE